MDYKQAGLGFVIFLVFWAFQAGLVNLGNMGANWFVGALVFGLLLWLIGKVTMPKPNAEMKMIWMFAFAFALIVTFLVGFANMWMIGYTLPQESIVVSYWLVVFGAAMFVTGWKSNWGVTLMTGVIWLFTAIYIALASSGYHYMYFGLVTGLPFILYGLLSKD